tara:strand:- start:1749 stop:1934 length:186 start_codon:yes stop_codon:yes gene_type:complete
MSDKSKQAMIKTWRAGYPPGTPCGPMSLPVSYSVLYYQGKNQKLVKANQGVSRSRAHNPQD